MSRDAEKLPLVLVVDDDAAMRELLVLVLRNASMDAICASSIEEARNMLSHTTPDILSVDIQLTGGADGIDFVEELSAFLAALSVPVVVVSASCDERTQARARAAGCVGFLPKPINPRAFPSELKRFLGAPHQGCAPQSPARNPDVFMDQVRARFLEDALEQIERFTAREDALLLVDGQLARAAHRWAGASNVEGLPNVEEVARSIERSAKENRIDQAEQIRASLHWLRDQYRSSSGLEPIYTPAKSSEAGLLV